MSLKYKSTLNKQIQTMTQIAEVFKQAMKSIAVLANQHIRKIQQEKEKQEKQQKQRSPIIYFEKEQPAKDSTKLIQSPKKQSSPANLNIICKQSTLLTLESKLDLEKRKQNKNGTQNAKIKSSNGKLEQDEATRDNLDSSHKRLIKNYENSQKYRKQNEMDNSSSKQQIYDEKETTGRKMVNPERPKNPPTAFLRFNKDNIDKVRSQHPKLTQNQLFTVTGMLWKKLTAQEKEPYEQAYEKDKIRYHAQMKMFYKKYPLEKTKKYLREEEKMMD